MITEKQEQKLKVQRGRSCHENEMPSRAQQVGCDSRINQEWWAFLSGLGVAAGIV